MRIRIQTDFYTNADTDKKIRMRDVESVKHGRRKVGIFSENMGFY